MLTLAMSVEHRDQLWGHLLAAGKVDEEAAFLFGELDAPANVIAVSEVLPLGRKDLAYQSSAGIELLGDVRAGAIKRAHDLGAVLIEAHSHPFDGGACFSSFDQAGLHELVPHVLWRLPGRPYVALVIAPDAFDGLVWTARHRPPERLAALRIGDRDLLPTGRSATTLDWLS